MINKRYNLKRVLLIAGSVISFAIGASFATGQEAMQFFAVYGFQAFLGIAIFLLLCMYTNLNYLEAGRIGKFDRSTEVFKYFCGKYIGTFYDWFAVFFCYTLFIVMLAGTGATVNEQYGVPVIFGVIFMGIVSCITVIFGLKKMINIIGVVGPVIIIASITAAIAGIFNGDTGIVRGAQMVGQFDVMAAGGNWFTATLSFCGLVIIMFGGFFAAIGKNETQIQNARIGTGLGFIMFAIAMSLVVLTLLANIELVYKSQIPLLTILDNIRPSIANIFSIIVLLSIYSTAAPLLWTTSDSVAPKNKYVATTIILTLVGLVVSSAVPFNKLVNTLLVINGYIGFVLLAFIIIRNIRDLVYKKEKSESYNKSM